MWLIADLEGTLVSPVDYATGERVDPTPPGFPIAVWREPTFVPAEKARALGFVGCRMGGRIELIHRWLNPRGVQVASLEDARKFRKARSRFVPFPYQGAAALTDGMRGMAEGIVMMRRRGPVEMLRPTSPWTPLERAEILMEFDRMVDRIREAGASPGLDDETVLRTRRAEEEAIGVPRRRRSPRPIGRPRKRERIVELVSAMKLLKATRDFELFHRLARRAVGLDLDPQLLGTNLKKVARMIYVVEVEPDLHGDLRLIEKRQEATRKLLDRRAEESAPVVAR